MNLVDRKEKEKSNFTNIVMEKKKKRKNKYRLYPQNSSTPQIKIKPK